MNTRISVQERVNCASLAAILVAFLLLAGHSLPSIESASSPEQPAPTAAAAVTETAADSVSVDSEPEPSGVRGLTVGELLRDAWTTYDRLPDTEPSGQYTAVPDYAASYDGAAPSFPATHFTIESSNYPGVLHVFHMIATRRA